MEDINILGEYENIELTTLLRTLKRKRMYGLIQAGFATEYAINY